MNIAIEPYWLLYRDINFDSATVFKLFVAVVLIVVGILGLMHMSLSHNIFKSQQSRPHRWKRFLINIIFLAVR